MPKIGPKASPNPPVEQVAARPAPAEDPVRNQGLTARALHAAEVARTLTLFSGEQPRDRWDLAATRAPGTEATRMTHPVTPGETASVRFVRSKVALHPSWSSTALAPAIDDGVLDLNRVTTPMLSALGPNERYVLMHMLASIELPVQRRDPSGGLLTGAGSHGMLGHVGRLGVEIAGKVVGTNSKENVAQALAQKVWASGDAEAFAKIFAAAPEFVLPVVPAGASRVLTTDTLTTVFTEMLASRTAFGEPGMDPKELDALGSLFARYFERRAGKKPEQLEGAFHHLIAAFDRSELKATPQTAGIVTGAIIAGMKKALGHAYQGKKVRAALLGLSVANIWAGTGFLGGLGPFVAVAVVGLDSLYQMATLPKDNREIANRCQGAIEAHVLDHPPKGWTRDDISTWIDWMTTTILSNGS